MKIVKQHEKLFIVIMITVILGVSTYAWFIGMNEVSVSSFDIEIAATESLLLSLDGNRWSTTVSINEDLVDTVSYPGHTNSWGTGLEPISTIGDVDLTSSRMIVYQKTSYSATNGGYKLLASRVDNTGADEDGSYVVFDLFIKNFSGSQYLVDYNYLNEEAIYLDQLSGAVVSENGGVANTGIENSVRVAFVPIGRVPASLENQSLITGITCGSEIGEAKNIGTAENPIYEVGICERTKIWEPNDTLHEQNAINWYNEACRERTGTVAGFTYNSNLCKTVENGTYSQTYPIAKKIVANDVVDTYDGADYNGYTIHGEFLEDYDYFTDTEKDQIGLDRMEFMRLAPNSITKVRIYVYLEGQDIDNYDYSALGTRISVNFGFTKERFEGDDIGHEGSSLQQPVINIPNTATPYVLDVGTEFDPMDIGMTVTYATPDELSDTGYTSVTDDAILEVIESTVDKDTPGTYNVSYRAIDDRGNIATTNVTVVVRPV